VQHDPRPAAPTLPVAEHCRAVLDDDRSGDPDGLVALAHHQLSPADRVVAVTSSVLDPLEHVLATAGEHGRWLQELVTSPPDRAQAGGVGPLAADLLARLGAHEAAR
jgi:hypothetical protein